LRRFEAESEARGALLEVAAHAGSGVAWCQVAGAVSSLDFELRAWILDPLDRLKIISEFNYAIDKAFRESNIRGIDQDVPRASRTINLGDNEYRKFVEKCEFLRRYCKTTFDKDLSPRQLDNLLLEIGE
jgi:hypothetical protein